MSDSVTRWLNQLRSGNDSAAASLWDKFFPELIKIARKQLGSIRPRVEDEEDVAATALTGFFLAIQKGRFPNLAGRDSLWRLLSQITKRRAIDLVRSALTKRAGGGKVRGESALGLNANRAFASFAAKELTPQLAAIMAEDFRDLLNQLPDDESREIALAKLEGLTNEEISSALDISLRTVERRLASVRRVWENAVSSE